jgi:hypothetical protein
MTKNSSRFRDLPSSDEEGDDAPILAAPSARPRSRDLPSSDDEGDETRARVQASASRLRQRAPFRGLDDKSDSDPDAPTVRLASTFHCISKSSFQMPYRLYVDLETLVEPVYDLTTLRRGDHCMVGLNPIRKLFRPLDDLFVWLSKLEVWPLYHHFVMYDDVATVDADGIARRADGQPALICEYSNTFSHALKTVRAEGLLSLWRDIAPYKQIHLSDYQDSRHEHGLLRVVRRYSDDERDAIIARLDELLTKYESYSLWFRNCEHVAFATTLSRISSEHALLREQGSVEKRPNSSHATWESLQVPHVLSTLARFKLQLIGTYCLYRLSLFGCDMALVFPWLDEFHHVKREVFVYHLFATAPVVVQITTQLGRAVRALVSKRRRGKLHPEMYKHLLGKEIARAVIVGLGTTTILVLLPRLMHDLKLEFWSACMLLIYAYMTSSLAYALLSGAGIRLLIRIKKKSFGVQDL